LKIETEIKLRLRDKPEGIRRRLRELGFQITKHRVLESNILYDNAKGTLRKHGKLIRIRVTDGHCVLTYKGPSQSGKYKKRPELEVDLSNVATMDAIFAKIGYHPGFRYQKFRTEYAKPSGSAGKVLLDETPIGNFLELEGTARWIDRTARQLGFSSANYITRGYGYLYLAYCRERRMAPKDMLFNRRLLKKG